MLQIEILEDFILLCHWLNVLSKINHNVSAESFDWKTNRLRPYYSSLIGPISVVLYTANTEIDIEMATTLLLPSVLRRKCFNLFLGLFKLVSEKQIEGKLLEGLL